MSYKQIFVGYDYPGAYSDGTIPEHRYVAETQVIHRKLVGDEHVHHVNEIKTDNSPENLIVFRTKSDHTRFHRTGLKVCMDDNTWISPHLPPKPRTCPECGREFLTKNNTIETKYCSDECVDIVNKRSLEKLKTLQNNQLGKKKDFSLYGKPKKATLLDAMTKYNLTEAAYYFRVPCNIVKLWCEEYGMEYDCSELTKKRRSESAIRRCKNDTEIHSDLTKDKIIMINQKTGEEKVFKNLKSASDYLLKNGLTKTQNIRMIQDSILRVLKGTRSNYLNFMWHCPRYESEVERVEQLKFHKEETLTQNEKLKLIKRRDRPAKKKIRAKRKKQKL